MKAKGVAPEGHKPLFCILPRKQIYYRINGQEILLLDLQHVGSGRSKSKAVIMIHMKRS
jgi:hypothetical protein